MFDKSQVSCNCFGTIHPNQQKFFLTRKREPQESERPQSVRRVIKSTEIKNDIQGKGQKKSLKKRPGSFVHSDNNYPCANQPSKVSGDIKAALLHDLPVKNKNVFNRGGQTPLLSHSDALVFKFPETTTTAKQTTITINTKQLFPGKTNGFHYVHHDPALFIYQQNQRNNIQLRPQLLEFQNQNSNQNYTNQHVIKQKENDRIKQTDLKPPILQIPNKQFMPQANQFYSQKSIRLHNGDWSSSKQDPLLIKDFQRLLKNKEDINYNKNDTKQTGTVNLREAQKSKRFYQQQLMGRFAESEDEECSQAPHSQVIGKGFDSTYQDLIDHNDPMPVEQTKASRSTNTKVSNLRGQKNTFDQHDKSKFGTLAHFTSYDRL